MYIIILQNIVNNKKKIYIKNIFLPDAVQQQQQLPDFDTFLYQKKFVTHIQENKIKHKCFCLLYKFHSFN